MLKLRKPLRELRRLRNRVIAELRKQMGERRILLKVEIGDFVVAALLVRDDGGEIMGEVLQLRFSLR